MARQLDILIDVDGVLADLPSYFLDWLYVRYDGIRRPVSLLTKWGFAEALGIPTEVEDRFFADVDFAKHCQRLPAYPGAREFVEALQRQHNVVACTTTSGAGWAGQRAEWLERVVGIPATHHALLGKQVRKHRMDADLLIEDSLKNCNEAHHRSILIDRPWNQGGRDPAIFRALTYADALHHIEQNLNDF